MLNRVILMGRITKDLEIRQSQSGTAVLRFTVAVDRPQKNGEKTADFMNCVAFGQRAEFISRYFGKGRLILIEGNIKTGSFEKNGVKCFTSDIWVDSVSFTGEKSENNGGFSGGNNQGYSNTNNGYNSPQGASSYTSGAFDEDVISDLGVPF